MQVVIASWLLFLVIATVVWLPQQAEEKSARKLVREATLKYPNTTLYSYPSHKFSVSYYTQGQVRMIENQQMLDDVLRVPNSLVIMSTEQAKETERNGQGSILDINASSALLITQHNIK